MKKATIGLLLATMMTAGLASPAMAETVLQLGTTVNEQDSFQVAAE